MSKKLTVPFCYLPNSKVQEFDMATCKRSEFQVNALLEVSQRDDFAYFVIMQDVGREIIMAPEYDDTCFIMWYDKEGRMYAGSLGKDDFLSGFGDSWRLVSESGVPVSINDTVYLCRTN